MWGDTSLCFWFTFPCLVMLIIFSSVCWSSVCCLWKNVYSGPLPIFFFFDVEFHESFIYFGYSVQFSHSVVSDSLRPHEVQHTRLPCPSPTPRVYSNPCPLSRWRHPTISSSVAPFSSCLQSFLVIFPYKYTDRYSVAPLLGDRAELKKWKSLAEKGYGI